MRLLTLSEDGTPITLGFWESGDLTGQPLICIQPSEIECLTKVQAVPLRPDQCWNFQQVMRSHLHPMQELIRCRQGQVPQRLQQLLGWLALKFGRPVEQGRLIQLRLTHQDMADAIGTSRVTVTRLMQELEWNGKIGYSEKIASFCPSNWREDRLPGAGREIPNLGFCPTAPVIIRLTKNCPCTLRVGCFKLDVVDSLKVLWDKHFAYPFQIAEMAVVYNLDPFLGAR